MTEYKTFEDYVKNTFSIEPTELTHISPEEQKKKTVAITADELISIWNELTELKLKAGRPEWHKVADGDLPKRVDDYVTNIGVLTYDNYGNGVYKWHTPFCEACDYGEEVGDNEVIAWCEIPKFEE